MIKHIYWIDELELWIKEEDITKKHKKFMKKYGFVSYHNEDIYNECNCNHYGGNKFKEKEGNNENNN